MPLIERIKSLQKQGMSEDAIIQELKEEGIPPLEINEAIDQSKVKSAVSEEEYEEMSNRQEMQPSVMPQQQDNSSIISQQGNPQEQAILTNQMPTTQEINEGMTGEGGQGMQQPGVEYQEYYPDYQQQYQQYPQQDMQSSTELIEQIIDEKTEKINSKVSDMIKFKTETESRISNIDERIKRIETIIDRLQASIIGRIGQFGQDISDLKSEMVQTQNSFSKILTPLDENIQELRRISESVGRKAAQPAQQPRVPKPAKTEQKPEKQEEETEEPKKKDGFERYLRG